MNAATWRLVKKTVPKPKMELLLVVLTPAGGIFEASRCHSKVRYWNKWLRRMARYAAARYEHMARYFSGVVSRLCIRSLHAVVTVLFHARLNIQDTEHPEQEETRVISGIKQSWSEILGTLNRRRQELSQAWSSPGQRYWPP
jgi:hypothetical protein